MKTREGKCLCGSVTYSVQGNPVRAGICHCHDCRRESGSTFTTFAVWPREAFDCVGEFSTHEGRSFCTSCGSRLFAISDEEVEIKLGTLDQAPSDIRPTYELWVKRREPWLLPLDGCRQYDEDAV